MQHVGVIDQQTFDYLLSALNFQLPTPNFQLLLIIKNNNIMSKITDLLGDKAAYYLDHTCKTIDKSLIHVPSSDTIDRIWIDSDRNIQTLRSLQTILGHGRLANTGYVSILPVDQTLYFWILRLS